MNLFQIDGERAAHRIPTAFNSAGGHPRRTDRRRNRSNPEQRSSGLGRVRSAKESASTRNIVQGQVVILIENRNIFCQN